MNRKTRSEAGRLGAKATLRKHGKNKLGEWGKLGGRPRKKIPSAPQECSPLEINSVAAPAVSKINPGEKPKGITALVKRASLEILPPPRQPETLPPSRQLDQAELLQQLVQKQVAEILAQKEEFRWEPYFRSRQVAYEIRRLQTVPEQRLMPAYYEKWGCFVCGEKNGPHISNACCNRCRVNRNGRLRQIEKELSGQNGSRREESGV